MIVLVNTVVMAQNHFGSCGFFLYFLVCTCLSTRINASEDPRMTWGIIFGCAPRLFVCFEMGALFEPRDRYTC